MRKYLFSIMAALLLVPMLGLAADVRTAEVVAQGETPKNLYLAGENPTVDANVTGDLVVAGGKVTVNGAVTGGIIAAGAELALNGNVLQSVRVAGGTVNIESVIGGDLVVLGGDVILGTKSVVNGDVIVLAGTLAMKGKVLGSVNHSFVGDTIITGSVAGNVELSQDGTLKVEPTAVIGGDLVYTSSSEAVVASGAQVDGEVKYTERTGAVTESPRDAFGSILFGAVMAFVTILVFITLLPKFAARVVDASLVNPWAKLGVGFLSIVVTPIALLVLLITFVGWGVMGYLFMAYMSFFALTGTLSALLVGSLVWKLIRKEDVLAIGWKTAAIGVVVMGLLKLVPVVGWLLGAAIAMVVFGTLVMMSFEYIKAQRA